MMKYYNTLYIVGLVFLNLFNQVKAQTDVNYSPKTVIYNHLKALQPDSYNPAQATKSFSGLKEKTAKRLAIQLKQILDGNGIYVVIDNLPDNPNYVDTVSGNKIYVLDNRYGSIYVERINNKWYYSQETIDRIPELYSKLYPLGFHFESYFIQSYWHQHFLTIKAWQ